jgi:hypothetical protein
VWATADCTPTRTRGRSWRIASRCRRAGARISSGS